MRLLFFAFFLLAVVTAKATTLAPELKAYDFAEAYYLEDGGVVLSPYEHGFYCKHYTPTPEGPRLMPGDSFLQYDPSRMVVGEYTLVRLNAEGTRAFFHQRSFRYKVTKDKQGKYHYIRQQLLSTNDFYLTKMRILQWFDHGIDNVEVHPTAQGWRSRPQD